MTNQAIAQILERDIRALAQELADATDYEAAGIMLRVASYPEQVITDRALATTAYSLITEARDVSGFTKFRKRLDDMRFSFDNAVRSMTEHPPRRTKAEVQAGAAAYRRAIGDRCVDGGATVASVARDLGISPAYGYQLYRQVKRRREGLAGRSLPPMTAEERRRFEQGVSTRTLSGLMNAGLLEDESYLTASDAELLRIPNFGRKSLREVHELRKLPEAQRRLLTT